MAPCPPGTSGAGSRRLASGLTKQEPPWIGSASTTNQFVFVCVCVCARAREIYQRIDELSGYPANS